ncbi:hypothetical protein Sste5346_001319 [Sporothrix stenoceras]|uniref:Uncharacterized protein n=1 Tax=Sporothrix stenoceras TaxID=5173 RepID=A0ABR3ZNR5_9PEZI
MADTQDTNTVTLHAGGWADEQLEQQPEHQVKTELTSGLVRTLEEILADANAMVAAIEQQNLERSNSL